MKKSFLMKHLTAMLLLLSVFVFGQVAGAGAVVESKTFGFYFKNIILVGMVGQLAVLFSDTFKHLGNDWSFAVFFETKLLPFLVVQGVAVVIVLLLLFVPSFASLFDLTSGLSLETITVATLFGTATAIADGIIKKFKKK